MHDLSLLLVIVVLVALAFDYINGFHDTANAIATVVSTRVLSPRSAILMATTLNFCGALVSVKVAKTISSGLVDPHFATQTVVLAAIIGAIVWNIVTWRFGIPSSSSHALIGGLVGAAVAHSGTIRAVIWEAPKMGGLKWKVLIPLVGSPVAGFIIGFGFVFLYFPVFSRAHPGKISGIFCTGQ